MAKKTKKRLTDNERVRIGQQVAYELLGDDDHKPHQERP